MAKIPSAFRTIGELAKEVGIAQHILRYWETRFPQLRPLQRAGNRRYYRPEDVALVIRIHRLVNNEGYTIKGVQKLLKGDGQTAVPLSATMVEAGGHTILVALTAIRARLANALAQDDVAARI